MSTENAVVFRQRSSVVE